jgi:hypothetical protein
VAAFGGCRETTILTTDTDRKLSPYARSGVYSHAIFWWLNGLLIQGYRQPIKPADLHDLDPAMAAHAVDKRFWEAWNESTQN